MIRDITGRSDMNDKRYPYTYAADLIRSAAGPTLSRSDASQIVSVMADVLGMDARSLSERLADHFVANEKSIIEHCLRRVLSTVDRESR